MNDLQSLRTGNYGIALEEPAVHTISCGNNSDMEEDSRMRWDVSCPWVSMEPEIVSGTGGCGYHETCTIYANCGSDLLGSYEEPGSRIMAFGCNPGTYRLC